MKGNEVLMVSGSDAHGTPITVRAEREGRSPQAVFEQFHAEFLESWRRLGITFDLFTSTHTDNHRRVTHDLFLKLRENGYIYPATSPLLFCPVDQRFLPDRYVEGTCPHCGYAGARGDQCDNCSRPLNGLELLNPRCKSCGATPEVKESEHFFLKLSAFNEPLKGWVSPQSHWRKPVINWTLGLLNEGLEDRAITRDIDWGVPIPLKQAQGKVLYGWFDNHLCYITTALKQARKSGAAGAKYWNSSTIYHFIGKDIVYHHYLFLPGMRIAEGGYKLPDYIPTRGYLLIQGKKISKSRNWLINVKDFASWYPADYLRFYLTRITPYAQTDLNFDWDEFRDKINNELVANIGNFVYRALVFVKNKHEGVIPRPGAPGRAERTMVSVAKKTAGDVGSLIEQGYSDRALRATLEFCSKCNKYFQQRAPWEKNAAEPTTVYYSCNLVTSLALLLRPFLPSTSEGIWRQVGLKRAIPKYSWSDIGRLNVRAGQNILEPKPLFRKIEDVEIQKRKESLPA